MVVIKDFSVVEDVVDPAAIKAIKGPLSLKVINGLREISG